MKPFIQRLLLPFHWLFVRLPKPFTLPFLAAAFLYFALLFPAFDSTLGHLIVLSLDYSIRALSRSGIPKIVSGILLILLIDAELILKALMTLLAAVGGILFSHLVAGKFYKVYRTWRATPAVPPKPIAPQSNGNGAAANNPLAGYKRIGIILSGGGAKGAYQAGAMKAIYEFLERYVGVRWYWPGDSGRSTPKMDMLTIPPVYLTDAPVFRKRLNQRRESF